MNAQTNVGWKTQQRNDHLKGIDIDGMIILERTLDTLGCEDMDYIQFVRNRG
jgi:hypothetical protein